MTHLGRLLPAAAPAALLSLLSLLLATSPAAGQTVVVLNDFEDGTPQAWIPRGGGVVLTNTEEVGSRTGGAGTHSLRTTGRTQGFHGPSLQTLGLLTKGATYQVTVWARLVAGQAPAQLRVTMQRTVSGGNAFDTIAQSAAGAVTDAGWVQMTGLYAFAGADPTGLLLYVEATTATTSYYIDDFRIDKIADPPGLPPDTTGLGSTFETGTTEGWTSRTGMGVVAPSSADAHTGGFSLLTTNRTQAFRGPNFNVTNVMFNGSRYRVSAWAKLAPGAAPAQLRVSLQRNAGSITTFHTVIGNTNVTADAWVRLVTTYDVALANSSLFLYVESASSLASFYIDDVQVTYIPPPTIEQDLPSLHEELAGFFPVGAAVRSGTVAGVHGELLRKHFNSLTSENDMKWDATEPTEGNFTFTNADQQVAFAEANGMQVRGHTLQWHQQVPAWVFTDPATGQPMLPSPANHDLLLQRLRNHVTSVVTHFADKVYAWDVVNEVIDENQSDCMRRSPWFAITGTDFMDTAFHAAREAAPDALLFINDFNTTIPAKRQCLFTVVAALQQRGVPVDGVGHQMHDNLEFPSPQSMADTLDLFAGLGLTQHVTEMDVSIYTGSNNTPIANYDEIPAERFLRQGRHYRDFFRVFRAHAHQLTSVTFWGLADDVTWLTRSGRVDAPLLFDDQLQHKLAYTGIAFPRDLPRTPAVVTLSDLVHVYDGQPHAASVATDPAGLVVAVTYDGGASVPVHPGAYAVRATIVSEDFAGTATGTLVIVSPNVVRRAPTIGGRLNGSLQVLTAETTVLNGSASVAGDLLVPGTPSVQLNGLPSYGGTVDAGGSVAPSGYTVLLNGGASLGHLVRRVDPATLPTVAPPPAPAGTRDVVLNAPGQSPGDFATLRNLTLNGGAGAVAVPPGTYGRFIANGSAGFVLGVAGGATPAAYDLQGLTLNGGASLQVVGPVTLTLASGVTLNAAAGHAGRPEWLSLAIASGGLTLNGGATLSAFVTAPAGTVMLNGTLNGRVVSDRLTINGTGVLNTAP